MKKINQIILKTIAITVFAIIPVIFYGQGTEEKAEKLYQQLLNLGIEVLWDDRDISPGRKFAESDLMGLPLRLVLSERNGDKIEWKERSSEKVELISETELLKRLKALNPIDL